MIESASEYISILESDDNEVRRRAVHDTATVEVWMQVLAANPELGSDIALNKNLDVSTINFLILNGTSDVRAALAIKRSLSAQQFEILADDADEAVRHLIASNRRAPTNTIRKLTEDPCEFVAAAAQTRLGESERNVR